MEKRVDRTHCDKIVFLTLLFVLSLISGCARTTQRVSPDAAPPEQKSAQEAPPSAPTASPAPPPEESRVLPPRESPASPPQVTPTPPQPQEKIVQDPIASASIVLNPLVPQDAQIIQTRLAQLGFYKGSIDGIWGKGSRGALQAFKERHSLEDANKWNKETQRALFRGASPSRNVASGEDAVSSGSILLNPLSLEYGQIIQTRLAELGFYKGAIDGAWGPASRAALTAFKVQRQLGSSDKWDKPTQVLLFRGIGK
jgi:peptidoglycan hydrolase-like protein with peptidoglycan-binding domain